MADVIEWEKRERKYRRAESGRAIRMVKSESHWRNTAVSLAEDLITASREGTVPDYVLARAEKIRDAGLRKGRRIAQLGAIARRRLAK